jgi:nicotinic acid mononucleotide adenylyltransferase
MINETIEENTYRLMALVYGAQPPFKTIKQTNDFKLRCQMLELAIAEEREACIKVAEEWFEEITPYDIRTYITKRRAPKYEVSE